MPPRGSAQGYFDTHAQQFDRLYELDRSLSRAWNGWVRRPFYRRYTLTMQACGDVRGKRILDVGCGSGRYMVALAARGADVVGIDFAANMLELARKLAEREGVLDRCEFVLGDFLAYDLTGPFDISLALGLFDYVADPAPFLQRMHALTTEKVILSFPPPGGWREVQRRIRYWLQKCPLYFHTQQDMARYLQAAGYSSWQLLGSWAVAYPGTGHARPPATMPEEET